MSATNHHEFSGELFPKAPRLYLFLDLLGTFVFAVEGAMAAAEAHLDAFGLLVVSFITALGGGILRDVLIGSTPPAALKDIRYGLTALGGGAFVFILYSSLDVIPPTALTIFDGMGLALFAVAGTFKSLSFRLTGFSSVLLGTLTGVGGGTVRDLLLGVSPKILHSDVYATAAMFGAIVMVLCIRLRMKPSYAAVIGAVCCFGLRMLAVWQNWNLPKVHL